MRIWWKRLGLTIMIWLAYAVAYQWIFELLGANVTVLALGMAAVTAWIWGARAGVFLGLASWAGHQLLLAQALGQAPDWRQFGSGGYFEPLTFAVGGVTAGYLGRLRAQLRFHQEVSSQAQYDVLTGLLNRASFTSRLHEAIEDARRTGSRLAVLFVDLDRFKFVNDTFGHEVGDELLREVAACLRGVVRQDDLVARLGGDEFSIALLELQDTSASSAVARKLVEVLSTPFEVQGKVLQVSASVGISIFPNDGEDVGTLTKSADGAMYGVKGSGKNSYTFATAEMRMVRARRLELERCLRFALENHEFELHYQPQVEVDSKRLAGFEALLRWRSEELGLVSPEEFIPIAEEAGLILPIGHWLLREACYQTREWQRAGSESVKVAVNISTLQFRQSDFLKMVATALRDTGLPPALLEIEITESVLLREFDIAVHTLRKLARLGVATALDDFGTGYSSLAYLQRLPIHTLKIDRSFVTSLSLASREASASATAIVEAICAMAHKLGKKVVAEGVESEAQRQYLLGVGCDLAQGFLFSRPLGARQAGQLLTRIPRHSPRVESEQLLLLG